MSACEDVFAAADAEDDRAAVVDGLAPDLCCENESVSAYSGPVQDGEDLIGLVVDDTHVTREDGRLRLKSSYLSAAVSIGASTLRKGRASEGEFRETVELLTAEKVKASDGSPRQVIGYVTIPAKVARELVFPVEFDSASGQLFVPNEHEAKNKQTRNLRVHGVYGTGIESRPSHADILSCNHQCFSKSARNRHAVELGRKVQDSFVVVTSIDEIWSLGV